MISRLGLVMGLLCPMLAMAQSRLPTPELLPPRKVVRDCALSLWGCPNRPGTSDTGQYDQIVQRARSQLQFGQISPGADLSNSVTELIDASRMAPERTEAWVTLAVTYAEQGACAEGSSLFERFLTDARTPTPLVDLPWKDRQAIQLGMALCHSLRGEPELATAQYQRLLLADGPTQRVLYRLGDALMAQGRPEEASHYYSQACLDLPPLQPLVNVSRSCAGLMAALDRRRSQRPIRLMMQLRRNDLGLRFLKMADFVPAVERDYYQALLLPFGCEREALLVGYLRGAPASVPRAYLRRAEEHLAENRAHTTGCAPTDPPASSISRPVGGAGTADRLPPLP
jgi:Tfp pilus assembly protein PilF